MECFKAIAGLAKETLDGCALFMIYHWHVNEARFTCKNIVLSHRKECFYG